MKKYFGKIKQALQKRKAKKEFEFCLESLANHIEVNNYVKPNACVYFIFSSFSDKTLLENTIEKLSLKVSTENSLRCDDEILYVMKISC